MEIKGKVNTALCYAKVVEAEILLDKSELKGTERFHTIHNYIDNIIDVIKESVDVIDIIKPIYNFKAN